MKMLPGKEGKMKPPVPHPGDGGQTWSEADS